MKHLALLTLSLLVSLFVQAEGTRQVAPNGSITINGSTTTDIAALHIDNVSYNNFMQYDNPDSTSRLYVRITDPENECIYLGFSAGHLNQTSPTPPQVSFEYRIKDPNGNVVFGPFVIDPSDANISGWNDAFSGPSQIVGPTGYDAITVTGADLTSQGWSGQGDFYIEAREVGGQPFLIDFWDVTVADCSGTFPDERIGRVWSYNWAIFAINDFGFPERPFNGAFFVCAPDPDNPDAAFVTRIDFDGAGFRPAAFNVAFNSFGAMNTGNVAADRRSVENFNSTQAEYAIFLNDPVEFCETAIPGQIDLLGVTRCSPDDYCVKVNSTKVGQIDLLLDFDGPDGMFTPGTADLLITTLIGPGEVGVPTCIDWDGLDGLGVPIAENPTSSIPVLVSYAQGIYHFPIYDAEFMTNGFTVEAVRPSGDTPLLFYDDSNISIASGSGEPAVQLSGCTIPCHRWTIFNDPAVPGFGNLNTINSWWFAQQIIQEDVFVLPAYYECMILGEAEICTGETGVVSWEGAVQPEGADAPNVVSIEWTGPDIIGVPSGQMIEVGAGGIYTADVAYLTPLGDTCFTSCEFTVTELPSFVTEIDTTIGYRDTLVINGELYDESGEYMQVLIAENGCDSVLVIRLNVPETISEWDLNLCESRFADGSNGDYSEFTPQTFPTDCGDVSASIVFREDPAKHSCTPGVDGSIAMCVGSTEGCSYSADDANAVIFEITVSPDSGSTIRLTNFSFFEKAPEMYDWIDGLSGPNNWPTLYGFRVLQDGVEKFRVEDVATGQEWTEQAYEFDINDELVAESQSTFRFELLGYCVVGNGAEVMAWDLDEISVQAVCEPIPPTDGLIAGLVRSARGEYLEGVEVSLTNGASEITETAITDENGWYEHPKGKIGFDNYLTAFDSREPLEGVTILDLLAMRKQMLGLTEYKFPYQYIAADINMDGRLSASDIVDLKKVMLMAEPQFEHGRSWRFGQWVPGGESLDFNEQVAIESFNGEPIITADFHGVKLGDVIEGGSVHDAITANWFIEEMDQGEVTATLTIDKTITALQSEFLFDGEIVRLDSKAEGAEVLIEGNSIRVIYLADESNGDEVQELVKVVLRNEKGNNTNVRIADPRMRSMAVVADRPAAIEIELIETVRPGDVSDGLEVKASPNPFTTETTLFIGAEKPGNGTIELIDPTGRVIHQMVVELDAGRNTVRLDDSMFSNASGLLYVRVTLGANSAFTRLVKLDR